MLLNHGKSLTKISYPTSSLTFTLKRKTFHLTSGISKLLRGIGPFRVHPVWNIVWEDLKKTASLVK